MKPFTRNGFSLVEALVVIAIGGILMVIVLTLLTTNLNHAQQFEQSNEGWSEVILGARDLNFMLNNVTRIEPPEDLVADGDELYNGVTNLLPDQLPPDCDRSGKFSALRLSSFSRGQQAERLLRLWSSTSVNKNTAADELRITTSAASALAGDRAPTELFLVDADGNWRRRFLVKSFAIRNTAQDPYDDSPKTDAAGTPIMFNYAAVLLGDPKKPDGTPMTPVAMDFLTSSIVIPVKTWVVCMSEAGQLIKIPDGGSPFEMMKITHQKLRALKFAVSFANSRNDRRVDALTYYNDLTNEPTRDCMNLVRFSVEVANLANQRVSAATTPAITLTRPVLLSNFLPLRPLACP